MKSFSVSKSPLNQPPSMASIWPCPTVQTEFLQKSCDPFPLKQIRNRQSIHIAVNLILSPHAPAERIAIGSNSGMNRPTGRNDYLFVGDHEVARLLARAHQMNHSLVRSKVEVAVNF